MGDVKWIKMSVDMFDDEKIKIIQAMPDGDALLIVWIKLIALAGKTNEGGYIYINKNMPYTDEMLAVIMSKPVMTIRLAMDTFKSLGMIDTNTKGVYLVNFEKHQSLEKLQKAKEQTRQRVKKHRENQKMLQCNAGVTQDVTQCNATEEEKEEEIEKEIEKEENKIVEINKRGEDIIKLYRELCPHLPPFEIISTMIKETLNNSLNEYTLEQFETVFRKASASTFLCGKNERKWVATFDWLVQSDNMAKVLNGKYDDRNVAYVVKNPVDGEPAIVIQEDKELEERMRLKVEELKKRVGLGDV